MLQRRFFSSGLTKDAVSGELSRLKFRTNVFRDNTFVPAVSGRRFWRENPSTGKQLVEVAEGDHKDVDLAVTSARAAFESGVWSKMAPADRKNVMIRWADLIDKHRLELTLLEVLEAGKPVSETFGGDIPETAKCIRWHAEAIDKINDFVTPTDSSILAMVRREPLGVVAAVLPWNFSAQMFAWKAGPALATGNSLIVKPAEQTSLATLRLAELGAEAGLPPGVLNIVPGFGPTAGKALALHNDVDCLAFTGSTEIGRLMLRYSSESNLKRVSLEMGGKSPQVVFADAAPIIDQIASFAVSAAFWNMSENCSCGSRLLVEESIRVPLLQKIQEKLDTWKIGDPLDPDVMVGPLIEKAHMEKVLGYVAKGKASGAKLIRGGRRVLQETGGYFVEPTIFDGVKPSDALAKEEIFGPVLSVIPFRTEAEAIAMANDTSYGLAASMYTLDLNRAHRVSRAIRAGCVSVNSFSEGDMTVPFGGYKQSGFHGRDKSIWAFEQYTELKTTWIKLQ